MKIYKQHYLTVIGAAQDILYSLKNQHSRITLLAAANPDNSHLARLEYDTQFNPQILQAITIIQGQIAIARFLDPEIQRDVDSQYRTEQRNKEQEAAIKKDRGISKSEGS